MLLKLKKNRKGFTLIELIVVVSIIVILAAIAVPTFIGMQDRAKAGVEIANASAIAGAINVANSTTPGTVGDGVVDADAYGDIPAELVPTFSAGTNVAAAYGRVTVTDGVATVTGLSMTPAT